MWIPVLFFPASIKRLGLRNLVRLSLCRKGSGDALEYRKIAIEMLGAMIPAGDIVSHTVAWTLLMLANRPTKAQRAAREAGRMLEVSGAAQVAVNRTGEGDQDRTLSKVVS